MPACLLPLLALVPAADFAALDDAVGRAVGRGDPPGAVVLVLHQGDVVHRKAYGLRAARPDPVPMTTDAVFDLASLTKPLATATSVLLLAERGRLRLADPVAKHWPAFGTRGKDAITIEHLLLHTGGLIADNPERDYADGRGKALERVCDLTPLAAPGERFVYSDVGFIVLGVVVERVGGAPLDRFARRNVFGPLGMADTGFLPAGPLRRRAVPTVERGGRWLAGEVHDPRAAALGGVAGHAGLFGTADDLAAYARVLLDGGRHAGQPFLAPETVRAMTAPRPVPGGVRALGWDVDTAFSAPRGDVLPRGTSFGHTGFTGTSVWLDPASRTAVILLTSRLHPDGKGDVKQLRGRVATLAAGALGLGKPAAR